MIYLGIDDTDTLDHPGTNKLARKIVDSLAVHFRARHILRHQLLEDPRVPCTLKNGCASIVLEPRGTMTVVNMIGLVRRIMLDWCPVGSDPGLCVATSVRETVIDFARRCQRELIEQCEARELAAAEAIYLEGLGGTQDGIIGALAAVGLAATRNDGRVVYFTEDVNDLCELSGLHTVAAIRDHGVEEIRCLQSQRRIDHGVIDVGKRLRPNLRSGKVVLFVSPQDKEANIAADWQAQRVV